MMNSYMHMIETKFTSPVIPTALATGRDFAMREDEHRFLKNLIWAYFFLLIFEGALRKWFLPELANPLLVVRDPLAILIVGIAWYRGLLPATPYLFGMVIIGVIALLTAILFGHGNVWVALFGARILLVHYPMVFAVGRIFTRDDVVRMGKATLWMSVPLAILIFLQFYSPQSAWVNRGVGGDLEGSGFSGAMGYYRPSATFSFTNGTTMFFGFAAAFIIYFWLNLKNVSRILLLAATISLLIVIPLSISRALFFGVGLSLLFAVFASSRKPKFMVRIVLAILGMALLLLLLLQIDSVQQALLIFTTRFETANETEGGLQGVLLDRYLGGMIGALTQASSFPFLGYGLGLGTNVGSILTKGEVIYLISEGEWGRLIGELGPLMGLMVILIRVGLSLKISLASYAKVVRGDILPWMLLSFGLLLIPQSQWGQPTTLGFSSLVAGLLLASLRVKCLNARTLKTAMTKRL